MKTSHHRERSRSYHKHSHKREKRKRHSSYDSKHSSESEERHDRKRKHDSKRKEPKYEWGPKQNDKHSSEPCAKEKPTMALSGNLLKDTNTYRGFVIKYSQPPEARKPHIRWRLYPFKDDKAIPFYQIHRRSAYLFGRNRIIVDIPTDHPSCSQQHAVLQFRSVSYEKPDGRTGRRILPYLVDLNSTNGTCINGTRIEAQRYYELREKDVIRFGFSTREYVLLHENSNLDEVSEEIQNDEDDEEEES